MDARTAICNRLPVPLRRAGPQGGFTYVGLLLAVALAGVALAAFGELTSTALKRDREQELLFVGDQIARAIERYRAATPGGGAQGPKTLEELVEDRRFLTVRRHLRQVYRDPMTNSKEWGLVPAPGGGIAGVFSKSTARPLKVARFPKDYESFASATTYAGWRFVAKGAEAPSKPGAAKPAIGARPVFGAGEKGATEKVEEKPPATDAPSDPTRADPAPGR